MVDKPAAAAKPQNISSLLAGLASVFKGIPNDKLDDIKDVLDMWNEPDGEHKNPTRQQIVTGPAESMSGGGAPRMIREYSSPAPQDGLTRLYDEFSGIMADFRKSLLRHETALKSILTVFEGVQKAQTEQVGVVKTAPGQDTFLGKALAKLAKAKTEMRKADLVDEGDREARKGHLEAAGVAAASANRLLAKATEEMEETGDEGEEETEKAMSALRAIRKAITKAEDEDKAEDEKAKSEAEKKIKEAEEAGDKEKKAEKDAEEAAKAKTISDAATEAAAKAIAMAEQVKKALAGAVVPQAQLSAIFDIISGKSANPGGAPHIAKSADPDAVVIDVPARVRDAIDNSTIAEGHVMKASALLQRFHAVEAGRYDRSSFDAEVSKAPAEVAALFRAAA